MIPSSEIIELKELRIGNILSYKGKLVEVSNLSLDIDDEYDHIIGFVDFSKNSNEIADWNRALAGDLKRIPLKEKWLEILGFEKEGGYNLKINKQSSTGINASGAWLDGFHNEWYFVFSQKQNKFYLKIKYVHELQNLYFALTGEDLQINETAFESHLQNS